MLRALLYLQPTFSMKSVITVFYVCADLSVEVKLTGNAGWKSPLPTLSIFDSSRSQVRSVYGTVCIRKQPTVSLHTIFKNIPRTFIKMFMQV